VREEHRILIRTALERYLGRGDPREATYRELARRHSLLPILPDWTGFVGLREDGAMFWVSEDDGSLSSDITEHALHLAKIRGPELFPEVAFLAPTPAPDWVLCQSCGGCGKITVDGQELESIRCLCGGIGRLPPGLLVISSRAFER
jgi:hypothetical protein